jgi:hypothetical protein
MSTICVDNEMQIEARNCAAQCWIESGGDFEKALHHYRRRHGGCRSVLVWIQVSAALIQIAYTLWKWWRDNQVTHPPVDRPMEGEPCDF